MGEMIEKCAAAILAKVPSGYGMTKTEAELYARTVVEVMATPTEAMCAAGWEAGDRAIREEITTLFEAMITAALKEADRGNAG